MAQVFEMIMLICFGLSWPFNIAKSRPLPHRQGQEPLVRGVHHRGLPLRPGGEVHQRERHLRGGYLHPGHHHGHRRPGADHPEQAPGSGGGTGGSGMKFVLATHNPGKLKEMAEILSGLGVEVVSPADVGHHRGRGGDRHHLCRERHAQGQGHLRGQRPARHRGRLRPLRGRPERRARRLLRPLRRAGTGRPGRCALLLQSMRGQTTRAAHFACAIACAFPNGDELTAEGRCDGAIAFAPMGTEGFGYDPCSWCRKRQRPSPS